MRETAGPRALACRLLNLPGHCVLDVFDLPDERRRVLVERTAGEAGCPTCGTLSGRVHHRTHQRLRNVPIAGPATDLEVVLVRLRIPCIKALCPRRTFVDVSNQVPHRARLSTRLRVAVLDAVIGAGRVVDEVAGAHGVSWWTVQRVASGAVEQLTDPDEVPVTRLGITENRYRSVRFFRDPAGGWRRYEPWMTTFVNTDTGRVLGVVDGRDPASVGAWLVARTPPWRERVQVAAIDPSAAFRRALREQLPRAAVSVDAFHLVKLAGDVVTQVRQRVIREGKGRRGRLIDPAWANRRLLLRAGNTLSARALARLQATFTADDPTKEINPAWGIKERLRVLPTAATLAEAEELRMHLGAHVLTAAMPETDRLWKTINTWWEPMEVLVITGVANARTEAANTSIKQIKRTGRGYRNPGQYQARILLTSAAGTTT